MSRFKILLIDFDGTIAFTLPAIYYTAHKMLLKYGYDIQRQRVYDNFSLAMADSFRCYAGVDFDDATTDRMIEEYTDIYEREGRELVELFPNVESALSRLKSADIKIVITSNNVHRILRQMVVKLGIDKYIDDIVCVEDVQNIKPAPDIALEALRRFGYSGNEALVVGDASLDMDMGREAGCHLCGVTFGSHSTTTLREHGAEYIIDSFDELCNIAL